MAGLRSAQPSLQSAACDPQRAPWSVQAVVQVTVLPWSHDLQALTHCFMSRGL
jgi:hypothetical protein